MQMLTSSEVVVRGDLIPSLTRLQSELVIQHPRTNERLISTNAMTKFDQESYWILPTECLETGNLLNTSFVHPSLGPPDCALGHTLDPFEDGVLLADLTSVTGEFCFTRQSFGTAGGLWGVAPYMLISRRAYLALEGWMKQSRLEVEPIRVAKGLSAGRNGKETSV